MQSKIQPTSVGAGTSDSPLVTFAVFAFNQEGYVREAIEGALSQTYAPLEIILSDDCSSDRTFEIIEEMASEYRGKHRIVLNRNVENLGLAGHINRVMEIARGELLVVAAGDDISLPERTAIIVETWKSHGRVPGSIYSGYIIVDESGRELRVHKPRISKPTPFQLARELSRFGGACVTGCSHAWTPDSFRHFGDLNRNVVFEDRVIPFRASIIGTVIAIDRPLIKYRIAPGSLSHHSKTHGYRSRMAQVAMNYSRLADALENNCQDLKIACANALIDVEQAAQIMNVFQLAIKQCNVRRQLLEGCLRQRVKLVITSGRLFSPQQRLRFAVLALAPWLYSERFLTIFSKFRS